MTGHYTSHVPLEIPPGMLLNPLSRRIGAARLARSGAAVVLLAIYANINAQAPVNQDEKKVQEIVHKADLVRFPQDGFQVDVDITSSSGGQVVDTRKYRVLSKGNENTIVMVTEPAIDRGQIMLMRGRDLWVFLPTVSQPVRLSLAQRLTGQVANGDIARANFTGDYAPRLLRTEKVDGEDHYVLELTAVDRTVTYSKVLYWVKQKNLFPHKAEFYSLSDRLLKTARYEEFKPLGGRVRPTRLVMQDALRKDEESVLEYSGMELKDLPDRMFTRDYLKRL
jgi:outer membrane lipoprotein-sorting protein